MSVPPGLTRRSHNIVLGHRGMVGSAIVRALGTRGVAIYEQPDLRRYAPLRGDDRVYLAAARVGGIQANIERPAEFLTENLQIQTTVFESARKVGVKRLLYLSSSCAYPVTSERMSEEFLWQGPPEATNAGYAIAKRVGVAMCQAYRQQYGLDAIAAIPCNLYGPGDRSSHVIPDLIRRFRDAKSKNLHEVVLRGTGAVRREFLHVDDAAGALVLLMEHPNPPVVANIGSDEDITIRDLAHLIADLIGFEGAVTFDCASPDGPARKLVCSGRILSLGWKPSTPLDEGLKRTILEAPIET